MPKRRRLAGVVAVAAVAPACAISSQASPPAAPVLACATVHVASAPAAGAGGQGSGWDLPSVRGDLGGVAARSSGSALAVGWTVHDKSIVKPIVARWNGAAWTTLSDPALPVVGALGAVALFPGGAWAVGERGMAENGRVSFPLMMRVTGTTVREVPIPRTTYGGALNAVAATSAADAWAVGFEATIGGGEGPALILHWNGTAWARVRLPATVARDAGVGVAATSRTNVWLAGASFARQPRIVHWNGRRWGDVAGPDIGMRYDLVSVATTSARNVWAAGNTAHRGPVILHWNGLRWTCALGPKMYAPNLFAMTASSADDAWAVGGDSSGRAVALHWNGHTWTQVMTPPPGNVDFLRGVAVIPRSGTAWAVGSADDGTLMLHWNGTAWQ